MSDVDIVDPIVLSIGRPLWSISHYIWSKIMQRLDPPDPSMYTDDQKRVADAISGTRGSIRGPFGPWLHVPGFADPSQQVGAFLRYNSKIPGNLRELAICTVGQYWQADYEWFAHAPLAVEEGGR